MPAPIVVTLERVSNASAATMERALLEFEHWHKVFGRTIGGVHRLRQWRDGVELEVVHKRWGAVRNILRRLPDGSIELQEFKPIYDARFLYRFDPIGAATRTCVQAEISLKEPLAWLSILVPFVARRLIVKHSLEPLERFAAAH